MLPEPFHFLCVKEEQYCFNAFYSIKQLVFVFDVTVVQVALESISDALKLFDFPLHFHLEPVFLRLLGRV